jgi:hypothetical protein
MSLARGQETLRAQLVGTLLVFNSLSFEKIHCVTVMIYNPKLLPCGTVTNG